MRMLIVDDEWPIRFALREYFTALGYEVDCADGMQKAEALLDHGPYAVLLVDLRLSGNGENEGLRLARRVRQRDPTTRIVILTAYGSPEAEAEAERIGVDAFLHKPQPLRHLSAIVRTLGSSRPR